MHETTIHSPGLEPPHPRLITHVRVCNCGAPLSRPEERRQGHCLVCECLGLIPCLTTRAQVVDQVLDRHLPLHPCAGDMSLSVLPTRI